MWVPNLEETTAYILSYHKTNNSDYDPAVTTDILKQQILTENSMTDQQGKMSTPTEPNNNPGSLRGTSEGLRSVPGGLKVPLGDLRGSYGASEGYPEVSGGVQGLGGFSASQE